MSYSNKTVSRDALHAQSLTSGASLDAFRAWHVQSSHIMQTTECVRYRLRRVCSEADPGKSNASAKLMDSYLTLITVIFMKLIFDEYNFYVYRARTSACHPANVDLSFAGFVLCAILLLYLLGRTSSRIQPHRKCCCHKSRIGDIFFYDMYISSTIVIIIILLIPMHLTHQIKVDE